MGELRTAIHIAGDATSIRHGTAQDRADLIVLAPTGQLASTFELASALDRPAIPEEAEQTGVIRVEGREAEVMVKGVRVLLLRGREFIGKVDDGRLSEGQLLQSDRLLLATQELFDCIEDVLLPSLMDKRPPDQCIESIRKLAEARGISGSWSMVVAAYQDPQQATINEQFSAEDLGVIPPAVFETEPPTEPRAATPAPLPKAKPREQPEPDSGGANMALIGGALVVVLVFAMLAFAWFG